MLKKIIYFFIFSFILSGMVFGHNLDNFDNDSSYSDEYGASDASWYGIGEVSGGTFGFVQSTITWNYTKAALCVYYQKTTASQWTYFTASSLGNAGNISNFSYDDSFSMEVFPVSKSGRFLIKLRDSDGDETADMEIKTASTPNTWNHLVWDLSKVNWQNCDRWKIDSILFFPQPGDTSGEGIFYIDTLWLGAEAVPLSSSLKNLLLDNYNDGSDPNIWGGAHQIFPNEQVLKASYFNTAPEQVFGRTGYSLQLWYGADLPSHNYSGYWTEIKGLNLSNYKSVSLWVLSPTENAKCQIGIKDLAKNELKVYLNDYLNTTGLSNTWQKVNIPLAAFTSIKDWTNLDLISFTFDPYSRGMLFIDDLLFSSFFPGILVNNFNDISDPNALGGGQGGLAYGSFTYDGAVLRNNTPVGKITSGTSGLVDDFNDGAEPNSWGGTLWKWEANGTVSFAYDSVNAFGGTGKCMKLDYNVSGANQAAGICLPLSGKSSNNDYIILSVKGAIGNEKIYIGLKDTNGVEIKKKADDYIYEGAVSSTIYRDVAIPLKEFSIDKGALDLISIAFDNGYGGPSSGTVYLDNVYFGRTGGWISLNGLDASNRSKLSFWVKGVDGSENLRVVLQDSSGDSKALRVPVTNNWARAEIALSSFTGVSLSRINAIHFALTPNSTEKVIYIDDIYFDETDVTSLTFPYNLKSNNETVTDNFVFGVRNILTCEADSYTDNPSIEGVRFEYSDDNGSTWHTIGTDYDTSDRSYSASWNTSNFTGSIGFIVRAVAVDAKGNVISPASSAVGQFVSFKYSPVIVYPNPFFPFKNSKKLSFSNIPTSGVLTIYTLSGEIVCTLKDEGLFVDQNAGDGLISWDGKNNNSEYVASGLYFYSVSVGNKSIAAGKFTVIK